MKKETIVEADTLEAYFQANEETIDLIKLNDTSFVWTVQDSAGKCYIFSLLSIYDLSETIKEIESGKSEQQFNEVIFNDLKKIVKECEEKQIDYLSIKV